MPQADRPFVLLRHELADRSHWDLMLDTGEALATWQLNEDPTADRSWTAGAFLPARRIADHRRAYLDYEGPVSGDRGSVIRVDRGHYFLLVGRPDVWTLQMHGDRLNGLFMLSGLGERWEFYRLAP